MRDVGTAKQKATEANNQFLKASRSILALSQINDIKENLGLNIDPKVYAEGLMQDYLKRTGALKIDPDISVAQLLHLYFSVEPPFSSKERKKANSLMLLRCCH